MFFFKIFFHAKTLAIFFLSGGRPQTFLLIKLYEERNIFIKYYFTLNFEIMGKKIILLIKN